MGGAVVAVENGIRDAVSGSAPLASRLARSATSSKSGASGLTLQAQPATAFDNTSLTSSLPRGFGPRRPTNVIGYGYLSRGKRNYVRRAPVKLASNSHSPNSGIAANETNMDAIAADRPFTTSRLAARRGVIRDQISPITLRSDTNHTQNTSPSITQAPAMVAALPGALPGAAESHAVRSTPLASQRELVDVSLSKGESKQVAKTESMTTPDALTISSYQPKTKRLASLDHKRVQVARISHETKPMTVSLLSSAAISVSASKPIELLIAAKQVETALPPIPTAALAGRLFGRSQNMRQRLVSVMGGTPESESAVDKALAYLASVQEPDGRWSFFRKQRPAKTQLHNKHDMALTGLASLCFLAANQTPGAPGKYQQCITDAIDFLADGQSADGSLHGRGNMYDHAIANLALAEAAIMTNDSRYTDAALAGGRYILSAQHPRTGGWRYKPRQAGDTSVLGWQILVLHSCSHLGLKMPQSTHDGATRWLKHVSSGRHGMLAGYMNKLPRQAMTAEAALTRMLLGRQLTEVEMNEACAFLLREHPGQAAKNFYLWYYCSLAMMQMQNKAWQTWNLRIRDYLVNEQEQNGSWQPNSKYGHAGGRVYSTALATLTLEVYYRYLPMYQIQPPTNTDN
jgi:prenyltransferase beta subunit